MYITRYAFARNLVTSKHIFDFHKKIIIKKIIKSSLNISWTGFSHGLYFFFKIKVDQSKFMNFVEAGEKYCRTKQTGSPP